MSVVFAAMRDAIIEVADAEDLSVAETVRQCINEGLPRRKERRRKRGQRPA